MNKIKNAKLVSAVLLGLSVGACGPTDSVVLSSSQREADFAERQNMIKGFDQKIAAFKQTMEDSKVKLANAPKEARSKYQNELDAMGEELDKASAMQQRLKEGLSDSADEGWLKAKQTMASINEELSAYATKVEDMLTRLEKDIRDTDRQKVIAQFETKLSELDGKIAESKKKLASASDEVRTKFNEQLAELSKKQDAAKERLNELKQSAKDGASDAWHKMKTTLDTTWDNIYTEGHKLLDSNN